MNQSKDWSKLSIKAWQYLIENPCLQGYKGVANAIGTNPLSARYALAYILEFCERENLPALTALVQNQKNKLPGNGFRLHVDNEFYFNGDDGFMDLYDKELKLIKGKDWSEVEYKPLPYTFKELSEHLREQLRKE
ncbi:hypothetical protein [Vibrio echinoideorum]|uniref:hypothetical protein n=1 Tax=Vibrio echinoideorum TaxID=2100116 RepID=UPI0035534EA2